MELNSSKSKSYFSQFGIPRKYFFLSAISLIWHLSEYYRLLLLSSLNSQFVSNIESSFVIFCIYLYFVSEIQAEQTNHNYFAIFNTSEQSSAFNYEYGSWASEPKARTEPYHDHKIESRNRKLGHHFFVTF
jgi:hypothetical protein